MLLKWNKSSYSGEAICSAGSIRFVEHCTLLHKRNAQISGKGVRQGVTCAAYKAFEFTVFIGESRWKSETLSRVPQIAWPVFMSEMAVFKFGLGWISSLLIRSECDPIFAILYLMRGIEAKKSPCILSPHPHTGGDLPVAGAETSASCPFLF